jgi:crotonobetaine/carnitine-CoA ligase
MGRPATPWEVLCRFRAHDGTLADLLASRAEADPERPLLFFGDGAWSYGAIGERVARAAGALSAHGVARGDRVVAVGRNSDAYVVLYLALARLGAILVPVNPDLGAAAMTWVIEHAQPRAIAVAAACRAALAGAPPPILALEGLGAGVPAEAPLAGRADDVCAIIYTSGTTGRPKGVMHAQRCVVMTAEAFVERMHLVPDDRLLCVLPLHHINALFYSLGGALAAGASLVLAERFSASGFWALAARTRATAVNIIAAIGTILVRRPRSEYVAGHALNKICGAPIPPEVADVFRRELGVSVLIEGYGMTEVPAAASVPFAGPHPPGSMGKPGLHPDRRVRFAELRVVGDDGRDRPDGEVGELWVRTPVMMKGYYRDPAATAAALRDGGWFATGDLARREADGFFYFVARRKDIIRRRGENLSGAELDRLVGASPLVAEVAVIAVPSDLGEDEVLAVVVPAPNASAAAIVAFLGELPPLVRPRYLVLRDRLPHTATHRVAKFELARDPDLVRGAIDLGAERQETQPVTRS